MSDITFQQEKLADVRSEVMPLLRRHWEEIALNKDLVPLDPDWTMYEKIEGIGRFHATTARAAGVIIGYAAFFTDINLHYRSLRVAESDIFYIAPEHRRGRLGIRLLDAAEAHLLSLGVNKFIYRTKDHFDLGPLLRRRGCVLIEHVYARLVR